MSLDSEQNERSKQQWWRDRARLRSQQRELEALYYREYRFRGQLWGRGGITWEVSWQYEED